MIGQIIRNQDALTKLSWWTRQSFVTCISTLIVVVCNTWQIKGHGSKLINPSIEQKINQLRALMELRWKWKKFGDILVQVKNSDNYEMSVLTNVLHVSNLSKSPIFMLYNSSKEHLQFAHERRLPIDPRRKCDHD